MIDFVKARKDFLETTEGWDNKKWNDVANNPLLQLAPTLHSTHLKNCKVLESREKMLQHLPKSGVVAEVGTQYGHFAEKILMITNPREFHIIDLNLSLFREHQQTNLLFKEKIENGIVHLHEGDSSKILANFPDKYFDWIYIDADHSYEGVWKDIYQGHTKLKKDGMLAFNDYTNWSVMELIPYGIARAVNEFCIAYGWEMLFFALHNIGYYDVAIRKIEKGIMNSGELQKPMSKEEQSQSQLGQAYSELRRLQLQVQQLQKNWERTQNLIDAMEKRNFLKLIAKRLKLKGFLR